MMCDSTNAMVEGSTGSEADAREGLIEAFAGRKGAIAITCFASNVARMKAVAEAAAINGRRVVLAGRSLLRMEKAARACGYLDGLPPSSAWTERRTPAAQARADVYRQPGRGALRRSAGSPAASTARCRPARRHGDFLGPRHPRQRGGGRGNRRLLAEGRQHRHAADAQVHVSGHPARDDLTRMYELVRPRFAVPVHGTLPHLETHARLARSCGVERALIPEDGDIIRLAGERPP